MTFNWKKGWCLLLLLIGMSMPVAGALAAAEIVKSPSDHREYQVLRLANRMNVILVSDPQTDRAAAALDINVGSSSEPANRPGLAHFLEHMLFLGTEKYPEPGAYEAFVSAHGGSSNAFTGFDHTGYYFEIDPAQLEPALDRFAQFFIAPLFPLDYVQRERHAVDAEFRSKMNDDSWRQLHAVKRTVNPAHPFARFAVGSLDSLTVESPKVLRRELQTFYRQHYSSNLMTLSVIGKEPLPQLAARVERIFGQIENRSVRPAAVDLPLFLPGSLPARLDVQPLKDTRKLTLLFEIPAMAGHYQSNPTRYLAHLISHEGPASLLSLLKAKGLAQAIRARADRVDRARELFKVKIALTAEGLARADDVAGYVFEYLRLIRERGVNQWLFDEQAKLATLAFQFRESTEPLKYARFLAQNLHRYPARHVLYGSYAMERFDPVQVRRVLDSLDPDSALAVVSGKALPTDSEERWFKTPYSLRPVRAATIERWRDAPISAGLTLPEANLLLPDDLTVKPLRNERNEPELIRSAPGFALWYKQDDRFRVPRADFFLSVRSPYAADTPVHAALTKLYVRVINQQLNDLVYAARLGGLKLKLYAHGRGFSLKVSGYSDKQQQLLTQVLNVLRQARFSDSGFALAKEGLTRSLKNAEKIKPYRRALLELRNLLVAGQWVASEQLAVLSDLQLADLHRFVPLLLTHVEIVGLAHGNLYQSEALAMGEAVQQALLANSQAVDVPPTTIVPLAPGRQPVRQLSIDHDDSVLASYYQGTETGIAARAQFSLLAQLLSRPFYQELRTEQQLGYIVAAKSMPLEDTPGMVFVVQSPVSNPLALEAHVERFLSEFARNLTQMSDAVFDDQKKGLANRMRSQATTLSERTDRYWRTITGTERGFDSADRMAEAVDGLGRDDMQQFLNQFTEASSRRNLAVRSFGRSHRDSASTTSLAKNTVVVSDWRELIELQ